MIIFNIKFWAWGSQLTDAIWQCAKCGYRGQFIQKKGMSFLTFYWIIPTIPVSGIKEMVQCPNCKTRYQQTGPGSPTPPGNNPPGNPPIASPWS